MSVEEYHTLPEYNARAKRTELLRGIVVEKKRKTPQQSYLTSVLSRSFDDQTLAPHFVRQHSPLTLRDSEPEPPISIVVGVLEDYWNAHPSTALLAVEFSSANEREDNERSLIYAEAGVNEMWMIDPERGLVEIHRRLEGGRYCEMQVLRAPVVIECASVPGVKVDLAELFAGLETE